MNEREDGLFPDLPDLPDLGAQDNEGSASTPRAARAASRRATPVERPAQAQTDLFGFVPPEPPPKRAERASIAESEPAENTAARPADSPAPKRRARGVLPAEPGQDVLDLAADLPASVRLGTSSWSFPGWNGIVYGDDYSNSKLAREGLAAYGAQPLLRSVSIDRSFYAPLSVTDYLRYAQQVPDHFRFIVKAPALITDASVRGDRGEPVSANPCFLNPEMAARDFVEPCLAGLGRKAGALVFQFPPLPDQLLADPGVFVERLSAFLAALPPLPAPAEDAAPGDATCYAVEIRDGILLTPRFVRALRAAGVRYCVGLHARMPDPLRQAAALALMDGEAPAGPLIVRWSLHSGFKYEQAKARYEPFDKLVDEDPHTRDTLAELAARYAIAGQPVLITTNNKAEGSAPLSCQKLARAIADEIARLREELEP
ncbi:uncharacterized protein YecE (DUF72 family) [Paraburkholderia bannensis]|uniref:Uncharacterized protein YecE (DUF72 family) n=1 Tax=Paraburkholderia bannensis TaxID=765414 RepID=A0A7W9TWX5_9BURK|nr:MULTISPECIES: DUF72 domain-containing protein [Paraburkholderia]MBB3257919.1 uncharacterized protein YecE (DUF72 family) [Paraburkholderia sp. WP4_3_2]MBB6102932.1 uncharacterized protein YecE (DUF72 family) [Paraburkholderia bannensis]